MAQIRMLPLPFLVAAVGVHGDSDSARHGRVSARAALASIMADGRAVRCSGAARRLSLSRASMRVCGAWKEPNAPHRYGRGLQPRMGLRPVGPAGERMGTGLAIQFGPSPYNAFQLTAGPNTGYLA